MAHISINSIEYIYSTYYTDSFDSEDVLGFIKVTFDFAYIKDCKLTIGANEIKEISDYEDQDCACRKTEHRQNDSV